jgi:phosphatidylglycerol:prolipoprotein diacylglycerol transferase
MIYPQVDQVPRHPSELYEAGLEGLVLLIVLHLLWRNEKLRQRPGTLTGCFLIGYAAARIFAEFFREPDAFLGPVIGQATMGQVLSVPVALLGIALIAWPRRRTP